MLISAVLLFLGVPLWMVIGGLILVFWNRHRVKGQPGIFPVRIRVKADPDDDDEPKWQRKGYAQWVHDVLILRTGMGMMKSTPYGISSVEGAAEDADPDDVKGLGETPKVLRTRLDDGSVLMVAVEKLRFELAPERFHAGQMQEKS